MSWSFSSKAAKADAAATFDHAHQEQPAYANDGAHKAVMDKIGAFAADIAAIAPEGSYLALSSSGHVQTDGHGSLSVSLAFYPPVVLPNSPSLIFNKEL